MSFNSITFELCKKTSEDALKSINPCIVCKRIPIPLLRDKYTSENVYCLKCANQSKINKQKATQQDKIILEQLIIDCQNLCGETFTYNNFDQYSEHLIKCNFIRTSKDSCFRCQKQIGKQTDNHDCLFSTNIRITRIEDSYNERIQNLESNQEKLQNKIFELLDKKTSDIHQNENLINLIEEFKIEKKGSSTKEIFNQEFITKVNQKIEELDKITIIIQTYQLKISNNYDEIKEIVNSKINEFEKSSSLIQSMEIKFDEFSNEINEKFKDFKINTSNFSEIERNLFQQYKQLDDKINHGIEKLEKEVSFNSLKSKCISELSSKFDQLLSYYQTTTKYISMIESDTFSPINIDVTPIESLKLNDDYERFQNQYESINKNVDIKINEYLSNKPVYGSIKNVIEKAHEKWVTCMILTNHKLISSSSDCNIKIWNLNSNILEKEMIKPHNNASICSLLSLPNECLFISGGDDCIIRFWDTNYNQINSIKNDAWVYSMEETNNILIVAGDNSSIFGSSYIINFYDLKSKSLINKINTYHSSRIRRILLLNSSSILLSASLDSTIKVWNINNYSSNNTLNDLKCHYTIEEHKGWVRSLIQLKYDKNIIVSCDSFGTILFSKINENYQIFRKFKIPHYDQKCTHGDNKDMYAAELFKYKMLVSVTNNSSLLFWNLNDYEIIRNVGFNASHLCTIIGYDDDEGIIFSQGNNNIVFWK